MATLLISGVLYQPFGSFPLITKTIDGQEWDELVDPFKTTDISPSCICSNGITVVIGASNGLISTTNDFENFSFSEISGGFYPASMQPIDDWFVTCGQIIYVQPYGPYPAMSEVAQIYRTQTPDLSWEMIWSHPDVDSRFYQIKKVVIDSLPTLVCCGSIGSKGDAWYSVDNGFSWTQINIPTGVGPILSFDSIELGGTQYYYWGCNGILYRSMAFDDDQWTGISIDETDKVVDIINDGTALTIIGQKNIYYTNDGVYLKSWNYPGYTFTRAAYINDSLVVFGQSILTQYTQWSTSNFVEWTPSNNGVHVSSIISIP